MGEPPPKKLLLNLGLWSIWATMFFWVFAIQFFLGGIPNGTNAENPPMLIAGLCVSLVAVATVIRWLVIPKISTHRKALAAMIVGLALSEAPIFFELFLIGDRFPETQLTIFVLAALSVLQFAPIYAGRLRADNTPNPVR